VLHRPLLKNLPFFRRDLLHAFVDIFAFRIRVCGSSIIFAAQHAFVDLFIFRLKIDVFSIIFLLSLPLSILFLLS
jgi:hypothetical protein